MKRRARHRLALLLGVATLVALALWQWQREEHAAPGNLTALDPARIRHVAVQWPNQPEQSYQYRGGHWWQLGMPAQRTDDGRLQELTQVAAAPVLQWRPAQDFSLDKIGLAPPAVILELEGQRIEFGESSVTGPQRYVRVGERIALIPARFSPRPMNGGTVSMGAGP